MKKDVIFAVLLTFCLTVMMFMVVPTRSKTTTSNYDPWADANGDGQIDMYDIGYPASLFLTSGDPTKNVNVTNWPTTKTLLPDTLVLYGVSRNTVYTERMYPEYLTNKIDPYEDDLSSFLNDRYWLQEGETAAVFNRTFEMDSEFSSSCTVNGIVRIRIAFQGSNAGMALHNVTLFMEKILQDGTTTTISHIDFFNFTWISLDGCIELNIDQTFNQGEKLAFRILDLAEAEFTGSPIAFTDNLQLCNYYYDTNDVLKPRFLFYIEMPIS